MELSNAVLAAALGAALMNAGWNSAIKLGGDKMVAMALTTGLASLWSLLVLPWLDWRAAGLWDASVWWWLAASVAVHTDRKSTRLNSSHLVISYAVFCLKKKTTSHATDQ